MHCIALHCATLHYTALHSEHAVGAFEVNCKGVYNAMVAAVANGHARLINTGPKEVHAGHQYRSHHNLGETGPPQSGLDIYSFSKG